MFKDFEVCFSTHCVFGKGASNKVGEKLSAYGAKKVLLHYGSGKAVQASGLLDSLVSQLEENGMEVFRLGGVQPNPRISLVREGIKLVRQKGIDFILAVGGGSPIDSAKAIGIGADYEGDVWDFYGKKVAAQSSLPVAAITTYPASGSETSSSSVLSNEAEGIKRSCNFQIIRPVLAFMDPELTYSLPAYQTAIGIVDIYSHTFERYFWDCEQFGITDFLGEALFRSLIYTAPKLMKDLQNYDYRAETMWMAAISHDDTTGVGRVKDGASHALGHELSALYDTPHGATLSIMIPAWMRHVYRQKPERFARYAKEVFGVQEGPDVEAVALEGIRRTEEFFKSLGAPICFKDAGIPSDQIDRMADGAVASRGGKLGNLVPLGREDAVAIYADAAGIS